MTQEILKTLIICVLAILIGGVMGNGAVWFFNRIPGSWLTEYGEVPSEELLHPTVQRIRSTPWKYVFTGLFISVGIFLGMKDPLYALPTLAALWFLLEMSIADKKYMIVPDQLILLLLVTAIGFVPYRGKPDAPASSLSDVVNASSASEASSFFTKITGDRLLDCLSGALLGFTLLLVIALLSKLFYHDPAVGGADIKLFAVLGLISGVSGITMIFVLSTLISASHMLVLLFRKRATLKDRRPMVPYIAIASAVTLIFLRDFSILSITF